MTRTCLLTSLAWLDNYNQYILNLWQEKANSKMEDDDVDVVDNLVDIEVEDVGLLMNHPAELALHQYLENAVNGKTAMSSTTIQQVATDVAEAMQRQFGGEKKRKDFRLRMSNVGRPTCQLWYDKNKPEKALPLSYNIHYEYDDWGYSRSSIQRSDD